MYYDAIEEIENNIPIENNNEFDPNYTLIYTINSVTDTNQFCNTYNHDNNYNGLKLGQRIQINDGTYNKAWYIAGFDCEYNHTASDGSIKDNGYGICLIPEDTLIETKWNNTNVDTAYINSSIHYSCINIGNTFHNILGSHIIKRNVLLGSGFIKDQYDGTNKYTWTTSYCELLTTNQIIGRMNTECGNKYDKGEANYKLPLFNEINFTKYLEKYLHESYWLREFCGHKYGYHTGAYNGWGVLLSMSYVINQNGLNTMIYIR